MRVELGAGFRRVEAMRADALLAYAAGGGVSPDDRTLLFARARPRPRRIAKPDCGAGVVRNVCRMQGI